MPRTRRIVIVVFDRVQSLDVAGPTEVFATAAQLSRDAGYRVELVSATGEPVMTTSGLQLLPHRSFAGCRGPLDTLLIAGGEGTRAAARDETMLRFVRRTAGRASRVASVCTGAFVLARAGLLDGRRATTHWASCGELARSHPAIDVDPDPIFVRDGDVATSAGVTAGMDLALALVEEDCGRELALEVARWLVLYVQRPGGQAQFSAHLAARAADRPPLRDVQEWIAGHLDGDLSVSALAGRAHMSPRNFARAFRRETGVTPAAYVEALRVEHARLRLETTGAGVDAVARGCGFGTAETMRRAFHRRLRVAPTAYRERFAAPTTEGADDGDRHPPVPGLHGAGRRRPV